MGTTIDKAVEGLHVIQAYYNDEMQDGCMVGFDKEDNENVDLAIETMQKYQKIEDIVRDYYNEQYTDKLDIEIIEMISEVLEEDGRWED